MLKPLVLIATGAVILAAFVSGAPFRGLEPSGPIVQARWTPPGCDQAKRIDWTGITGEGLIQVSSDVFLAPAPESIAVPEQYGSVVRITGRLLADLIGCAAELPQDQVGVYAEKLRRLTPMRVFLVRVEGVMRK